MTKIKSIGKIVAISMMSAIISISFNGCGFFGSSTGELKAGLCEGEGVVTIQEVIEIYGGKNSTIAKGECKGGVKEGLWKYYNVNDSSKLIQEATFVNGKLNGVAILDKRLGKTFYLYDENSNDIIRYRHYDATSFIIDIRNEHNKRVSEIENKNHQMQQEANEKYEEAKAKAQEIAKQRAESKVKKPTMQEVKKSKSVMDTYRAKLKAQEEKELQIELSKIQAPQVKQTIAIPPYKEPKLDTYEELLSFVKYKKYTLKEKIVYDWAGSLTSYTIESSQDSDSKNFQSEITVKNTEKFRIGEYYTKTYFCKITNNDYKGEGCQKVKEYISLGKSVFKDKINAVLPN